MDLIKYIIESVKNYFELTKYYKKLSAKQETFHFD